MAVSCGKGLPTEPTPESSTAPIAETELNDGIQLVAGTYCGATSGDPYKCCVNSPGVYGNCVLGAWEQAKKYWGIKLSAWGDAGKWASAASASGFYVDSSPSKWSIGVGATHVAFVLSGNSSTVSVYEQQCGFGFPGQYRSRDRPTSTFSQGFIRAPIPEVILLIWNGTNEIGNGGTLTVKRALTTGKVTVSFGFSRLRPNVTTGGSTFQWKFGGSTVSTAGKFDYVYSAKGTYSVSATVTNTMGVKTTQTATVVVQ